MKILIKKLKEKGYKISTAESCTGGLVSKLITDSPGASEVFDCAVITYSAEAKINLLGVNPETISEFGVVSEETAVEMAKGVLRLANSDIAVSVTGIAGPGGAEAGKPVGTVCIGVATSESAHAATFLFAGNRSEVRRQSAKTACKMALDELGISPKKEHLTEKAAVTVKKIRNKITKK